MNTNDVHNKLHESKIRATDVDFFICIYTYSVSWYYAFSLVHLAKDCHSSSYIRKENERKQKMNWMKMGIKSSREMKKKEGTNLLFLNKKKTVWKKRTRIWGEMKQKPKEGNKSKRLWKRKSFNVVKLSAGVFLQTIKSKYYKKYCFCGLHHRHRHHQQTQFEIHSIWNMTVSSLKILTIDNAAHAILSFIVKREIIKLFEKKEPGKQ